MIVVCGSGLQNAYMIISSADLTDSKSYLPENRDQATMEPTLMIPANKAFWDTHGRVGLVWSNPDAPDDVLIAAALLKQPNFHLLLDIAAHIGLDRLKTLWTQLKESIEENGHPEERGQLLYAQPIVDRCIKSFEEAIGETKKETGRTPVAVIHGYLLPHDLARLETSRLLWKNPNTREMLLRHWEDDQHPYQYRFKLYRTQVEQLLDAAAENDDELDHILHAEGFSLRVIIREIPPIFGSFYGTSLEVVP